MGAFAAILLNIFLPEEYVELEEHEFDPEASVLEVMQNPSDEAAAAISNPSVANPLTQPAPASLSS